MPTDQVAGLFEPFRRLATDRVESVAGAGLGLSIVRSVARAHGGVMRAVARPDGGLDVTVSLPSTPAEVRTRAVEASVSGEGSPPSLHSIGRAPAAGKSS